MFYTGLNARLVTININSQQYFLNVVGDAVPLIVSSLCSLPFHTLYIVFNVLVSYS